MNIELKKRIFTSFILLLLLILMPVSYFYINSFNNCNCNSYMDRILCSESKIAVHINNKLLRFAFKSASLLYLSILVFIILIIESKMPESKIFIYYSLLVSIVSDIGGLTIGKIIKGKKLIKISPQKTISGSIGSIAFSFLLIPFFIGHLLNFFIFYIIFNNILNFHIFNQLIYLFLI